MPVLQHITWMLALLVMTCAFGFTPISHRLDAHASIWQQGLELSNNIIVSSTHSYTHMAENILTADGFVDQYSSFIYFSGRPALKAPNKYASPRKRDGPFPVFQAFLLT